MGYSVKVLCDSVSPEGVRLTTMEATYPRFVHSEFMTHRMFSRNAASSRAIPIEKMIQRVWDDPVYPIYWGKNQRGMAAKEELSGHALEIAKRYWGVAQTDATCNAELLSKPKISLHKQIVNRILEPFSWITVIVTATEWNNFFTLRCHEDAQPEIRKLADMMYEAYTSSTPVPVDEGEWHRPLISPMDISEAAQLVLAEKGRQSIGQILRKVSVARCARVSYLTHDGKRDIEKDLDLYDRLLSGGATGHWSPFEHVATPIWFEADAEYKRLDDGSLWSGNFRGWKQYRKCFDQENSLTFKKV